MVKKIWRYVYLFRQNVRTWQTHTKTHTQINTAWRLRLLLHSIARQKRGNYNFLSRLFIMSVYVLCVNSIMFIETICSIPLTLCFVFVFILFSVLPYGEIKLCNEAWENRNAEWLIGKQSALGRTSSRTEMFTRRARIQCKPRDVQRRATSIVWRILATSV